MTRSGEAASDPKSANDLDSFVRLVLNDRSLQSELRDANDRRMFVARVAELGRQRGYEFSKEDVEEAMRSNRKKWLKT